MGVMLDGFLKRLRRGLGHATQGLSWYTRSPLGRRAAQTGLSHVTGEPGAPRGQGFRKLDRLSGAGRLLSTFSGFASRFLGQATHLLSLSGLNGLWAFLQGADSPRELLGMTQQVMAARRSCQAKNPTTELMANRNLFQLVAYRYAQTLKQQVQNR